MFRFIHAKTADTSGNGAWPRCPRAKANANSISCRQSSSIATYAHEIRGQIHGQTLYNTRAVQMQAHHVQGWWERERERENYTLQQECAPSLHIAFAGATTDPAIQRRYFDQIQNPR